MVLVDTSVWIEVFRKPARIDLQREVEFDDIVTCLPVIQEVLQGFDDERAFLTARESMFALPVVESPMSRLVYEEAVTLSRSARRSGLTVRSGVDCLIAACAIRNGLEVLHFDRDYDTLARVSALKARRVSVRASTPDPQLPTSKRSRS